MKTDKSIRLLMLVKIVATSTTTEKLSQRMARHRRDYKSYLNNTNPQKHYPNSMKSFDEFGVENRKIVLIEEYPCQNRKQPEKKEGEYIENDKNCLSKCIVGRTRKENCDATREHHLEQKDIRRRQTASR